MKKYHLKTVIVLNLVAVILAQIYFGTVFNESVRNPLDLMFMLYASAGLVLNRVFQLGLPFDGPSHSTVLCLSALVYTSLTFLIVFQVTRSKSKQKGKSTE
jgi:ABC-type Fe3+-siderophore transport system permease subunit